MPKREASINVTSEPGKFPVTVETSFTGTPAGKDAKLTYKVRIAYDNMDQLIQKAVRATVINCGTLITSGEFPHRGEDVINVNYRGQCVKTAEEELQSILSKSDEEKAAYLQNLQEQLKILQKSMSVAGGKK